MTLKPHESLLNGKYVIERVLGRVRFRRRERREWALFLDRRRRADGALSTNRAGSAPARGAGRAGRRRRGTNAGGTNGDTKSAVVRFPWKEAT